MSDLARLLSDAAEGEVVGLSAPNSAGWVHGYLSLLSLGAVPLLFDAAAPETERGRWLTLARGGRTARLDASGAVESVTGAAAAPAERPGTVILASSGSTGRPKLVRRTVASLKAEGARLADWAGLGSDDTVVLPIPLWHSYALGWLHACRNTGAAVRPVAATALRACLAEIERGATVMALTPGLTRLLTARAAGSGAAAARLRLVMVGAGPVTSELESRFSAVFGTGLARNYGSTETGALLSAPPGVGDGCVGRPMTGVAARITGADGRPAPAGTVGALSVRIDGGDWHEMGDLAVEEADGIRIVGRTQRSLRRGDRWVAPEEVETTLLRHPRVVEARVVGAPAAGSGDDAMVAEAVLTGGPSADSTPIAAHAAAELAPHKRPERIRLVGDIPRGSTGKPRSPGPLRLADTGRLAEAARAHKRAELLFALVRTGIVDALARGAATPQQLAEHTSLDRDACADLCRIAVDLGLLESAPAVEQPGGEPLPSSADLDVLRWEERVSRTWNSRGAIAALARGTRPFDREPPDPGTVDLYRRVMHPAEAARRAATALRLAGHRPGHGLLEITCGPGRYTQAAGTDRCEVLRVGALAPGGASPAAPSADRYDLVVVCNAVHLPGPGSDLELLRSLLAPGGRLLIDDVFADTEGGLGPWGRLDWLTHGGSAWPTESVLVAGLGRAGLTVRRTVRVGTPTVTLLVAQHDNTPSSHGEAR